MLVGDYEPGDVAELSTYATVNGVRREVESVSLDRELSGDLPDQVVAGGGVSGASGSIQWAAAGDVADVPASPWHKPSGWPPSPGDEVRVWVSDGDSVWVRFVGVIDKTTGDPSGGMQSTVIDFRDQLDKPWSHQALLRRMTPHAPGGEYRGIGLDHYFFLTAALRYANFHNVTPPVASMEIDVPLQGSAWPERGTCVAASGAGSLSFPNFQRAPWGYAASSLEASYEPREGKPLNGPFELGFMVAPDHAGTAYVSASDGTNQIRLRVSSNKTATAIYMSGSTETVVATITGGEFGDSERVQLFVEGGQWTLEAENRAISTGQRAVVGGSIQSVFVSASADARIAGVQLRHPTTAPLNIIRWTPTMRFERPLRWAPAMRMSPEITRRTVGNVVDEICKATLTAAWFDESGVLQLVPSDLLRVREPVQTVTTLDDITSLSWEDSLLSVRSGVEVTWKRALVSQSRQQRINLWQGSSNSMEQGDTIENFATPEGGVEWFGTDRSVIVLDDTNWGAYNSQIGSFTGAYYTNDDGDELPTAGRTLTVEQYALGPVGLQIIHTAGNWGGRATANLATSPSAQAMRAPLRNESLPIVRGFGRGEWVEEAATASATGPGRAPAVTHDLSYWGTDYASGGSMAQIIADFLADQVTTTSPTITDLRVIYDPRRQLGDVITIESGLMGISLRALIVGISEDHAPGDHSQSLKVRIISATSNRDVTYEDLAAAWGDGNYAGLELLWAGMDYNDFENDPLRGR